jgi:flagellar motor switch protein FliG
MPAGPTLTKETLTGAQKCAILCMAIGAKEAGKILKHLQPDEVEMVAREVVSMPAVPPDIARAVLVEFQETSRASATVASGGVAYAQQILEQALGAAKGSMILEKVQVQRVDSGLMKLRKSAPEILAGILRNEHPQTSALILSHLDLAQASAILQEMDHGLAGELLYRLARMEKVSPDVLELVSSGLDNRTELMLTQDMTVSGGPTAVAKILNQTTSTMQEHLLKFLTSRNAEIATQVRSLMFVFEDLLLIDGKGIQHILREIETKELALALKAASEELKFHIKSNMSERAAEALEEEIELLGPVRVKDVEAAHARITETARLLEQAGEIIIRRDTAADEIIA